VRYRACILALQTYSFKKYVIVEENPKSNVFLRNWTCKFNDSPISNKTSDFKKRHLMREKDVRFEQKRLVCEEQVLQFKRTKMYAKCQIVHTRSALVDEGWVWNKGAT